MEDSVDVDHDARTPQVKVRPYMKPPPTPALSPVCQVAGRPSTRPRSRVSRPPVRTFHSSSTGCGCACSCPCPCGDGSDGSGASVAPTAVLYSTTNSQGTPAFTATSSHAESPETSTLGLEQRGGSHQAGKTATAIGHMRFSTPPKNGSAAPLSRRLRRRPLPASGAR